MNLDAFWSRASSTVKQNHNLVCKMIEKSSKVGIPHGPFIRHQPFPPYDHCGYHIAYLMLDFSLDEGRYHKGHKQFDSIRKIRSAYSNFVRSTPATLTAGRSLTLLDNNGKTATRIGQDESGSLWFSRFVEGCRRRMGQDWRPDQAITPDLLLQLLEELERKILSSTDYKNTHFFIMAGTYFAVSYDLSLRGPEGLLLDLGGILEHGNSIQDKNAIVVAFWGQFKGEHSERRHLLPSINITSSGIKVRQWIQRAVALSEQAGRSRGPLMQHITGDIITSKELDDLFHQLLLAVFTHHPHLFPSTSIQSEEDIPLKFSCFRSFRRGSNTRAKEMGISTPDTDIINRWRSREKAGTKKVGGSIDQMYTDLSMLVGPFLRYTSKM